MRPAMVVLSAVIVCALIGAVALFSPSGCSGLKRLQTEEEALSAEVKRKEAENARTADEIEALRGDDAASRALLEKKAREDLGYIAPGEVLLTVPDTDHDVDAANHGDAGPQERP